jgi:hypothetical protein
MATMGRRASGVAVCLILVAHNSIRLPGAVVVEHGGGAPGRFA